MSTKTQAELLFELRCFGRLEIQLNQKPITDLVSRKADALVAYLACNPHVFPREVLADLLWDDRTQRQSLGNLRVVLNSLRHSLPSCLKITRQTVQMPRTSGFWADAVEFESLVNPIVHSTPLTEKIVADLQRALTLYQGDFLAGFFLRDAQQFDEWISFERERYHIGAVRAAQRLSRYYRMNHDHTAGIAVAQRWVQLDPFNENAHQTLMELLVQADQRTVALEHYQQFSSRVEHEGLLLSSEFQAFYQKLVRDEVSNELASLRIDHVAPQSTAPHVPSSAAVVPHNLPFSLLPLIGRTEELNQIQQRMQDAQCRLLTIIGMGGAGKTRLAVEAGLNLSKSASGTELFRDGIYFVRLDSITPEQLLLSVIADAIGYTFQGTYEQAKQLLQYLRSRHMLLILDNFEHLLHQSDFLLEILHHAPHLKLMVTSRTRLEFMGEWLLPIEGLPYPQVQHEMLPSPSAGVGAEIPLSTATPSRLGLQSQVSFAEDAFAWDEFPATNLFILTARTLLPTFHSEQERDSIIAICRALDGLPLGLQLAAAAVHTHRCQEIALSIQKNLDFINSTMRNLPERHRSLRAVFLHSWQLLSPEEKRAFANLAVFVDGFSAAHAEAVAGISQTLLTRFNTKSLIQAVEGIAASTIHGNGTTGQQQRYYLHSVLHQFATEELARDAENEAVLRKEHALYFCRFAIEQSSLLGSLTAAEASATLAVEIENLRTSWRYALTQQWDELLYNMLPVLIRFYLLRGFLQDAEAFLQSSTHEVEQWLDHNEPTSAIAHYDRSRKQLLSLLQAYQAELKIEKGLYEEAILAAQDAIVQAKTAGDQRSEAYGALQWGIALNYRGLYKQAKEQLQHGLAMAQAGEMTLIEATAHRYLGINNFYQGDYTAGRLHHEVAIRLYRESGNLIDELRTYHSLAMLYFYTGDYPQAKQHYERCRQEYQKIGDRPTLSLTLNNLGAVSSHLGDYPNALRSFEEALTIRRHIGDRQMEGLILANMGLLAHLMNDNRQALVYNTQALEVSMETGERDTEAYARTCLAHALLELGRIAEATVNYEQALEIRRNNSQLTQALEPLAGLARVYLRLGDVTTAAIYVTEILPYLNVNTYAGIVELIRIYLTCYRVLYLQEDPHAKEILTMGHMILQERAAKILDPKLRKQYFENIIAHRELMTEYETQMVY